MQHASLPVIVKVIAADPLARRGLVSMLEGRAGIEVRDDAPTADRLDAEAADVVLWDLGLPSAEDWEKLGSVASRTRLVAITSSTEAAARAWANGARSILLRGAGPEQLDLGVLGAARGVVVLDSALAQALLDPLRGSEPPSTLPLSPRELAVLELVASGLSNRQIAAALTISEHTAKFHVNAILEKLGASTRTEAATKALRLGLVAL